MIRKHLRGKGGRGRGREGQEGVVSKRANFLSHLTSVTATLRGGVIWLSCLGVQQAATPTNIWRLKNGLAEQWQAGCELWFG